MSLFTSNSSPRDESPKFLWKVAGVCLLILTAYSYFARGIQFKPFFAQSQFQDNQYKAEYFLNLIHSIDPSQCSVIVGSSLGARMREEYLPDNILNLSFSGGSALTGLEFIQKTSAKFKKVFVDATVLRSRDEGMLAIFGQPAELWRITKLKVGNVDQQPVSLVSNFLRARFSKSNDMAFDPTLFAQGMERQRADYGTILNNDQKAFVQYLGEMKVLFQSLQTRGTQIVMIETPIDPDVAKLPGMKWYLDALDRFFKNDKSISWIRPTKNVTYTTTDGIHMTDEAARSFAKELR